MIAIKGMSMPQHCSQCMFHIVPENCDFAGHYDCVLTKKCCAWQKPTKSGYKTIEKINCPLVDMTMSESEVK